MLLVAMAQTHRAPSHAALLVCGVLLTLFGVAIVAAAFTPRVNEWANTHNRAFQRVPHYSRAQSAYNIWAARAMGAMLLGFGIVILANL
jgi:hypothetical protein